LMHLTGTVKNTATVLHFGVPSLIVLGLVCAGALVITWTFYAVREMMQKNENKQKYGVHAKSS